MDVVDVIKENLQKSFERLYNVKLKEVHVEHPQNHVWGDYSSNIALVNAKTLGKIPAKMASELVGNLQDLLTTGTFEKIQTAGPGFINFTLSRDFYLSKMLKVLKESDNFGRFNVGRQRRVALEHSNVNPNKAAHIGHLRNAVIGQFIERAYKFIGYDVNVQYYANDLGVQVSTSLLGVKKLADQFNEKKYKKFDHYLWDVYAKISQMVEEDASLKKELAVLMSKLDARDPKVSKEQEELSQKVLKDNIRSFASLGIDYDLVVYESSIKDMLMWERAFAMLKGNENVYLAKNGPSKGCWLVSMGDNKGSEDIEEDKIIVRSNGIPTYTGKDIAYHLWKFGLLGVDFRYRKSNLVHQNKLLYETSIEGDDKISFTGCSIVVNVIDVKQTYAIDAVRKSLNYLGYKKQAGNLIHVNYGHVYLSSKTATLLGVAVAEGADQVAMSGRKGVGIKIDDFIDMVDKTLNDTYGDFPNKIDVRNSVIKFDLLRYDTFQDVVFDIDSALSIKGFTGPYVQYTHARACSVLEKAGFILDKDVLGYLQQGMSKLDVGESAVFAMKVLYRFPEVVLESTRKYAPNDLCVYLYDLCQKFNTFYSDSPIINAENPELKEFRLLLTAAVKQVLKSGLYLLGINAVDKM